MWELVIQSRGPVNIYRLRGRKATKQKLGQAFLGTVSLCAGEMTLMRTAALKAISELRDTQLLYTSWLLGEEDKSSCQLWIKDEEIQIWAATLFFSQVSTTVALITSCLTKYTLRNVSSVTPSLGKHHGVLNLRHDVTRVQLAGPVLSGTWLEQSLTKGEANEYDYH